LPAFSGYGIYSSNESAEGESMGLGLPEITIVLFIALLLFGPSRLPGLGESLGKAIRGFKEGMKDTPAEPAKKIE
jgi:sec-independent protein translocase protein TatA